MRGAANSAGRAARPPEGKGSLERPQDPGMCCDGETRRRKDSKEMPWDSGKSA